MSNFQTIILLFSLSVDLFFVGLSFGIERVNISNKQNLFLSAVGTIILVISILVGKVLSPYLGAWGNINFSSWIFILLGLWKCLTSIKSKLFQKDRKILLNFKTIEVTLQIKEQDIKKHDLSYPTRTYLELFILSVVLSLDNIIAGIGIGLQNISFVLIISLSFLISYILLLLSNYIGNKLSSLFSKRLESNWISGILFLVIGIFNV